MEAAGAQRLFAPPPLPARHVSRARLLDQLEGGSDAPITLVAAGAGAGKTVLLAEWVRRSQARTAWLSLAPADDDPVRFWRRFTAALRSVGVARTEMPAPLPAEVGALLRKGHTHPVEPACIVLDDAHVLRDPRIRAGLDGMVRAGPSPLRLVLAARSDPLLPLPRYRLAGTIREIRAGQLIMTVPEARELLQAHDITLPPPAFEALLRRTEGWTAGLELFALRMEGVSRPGEFVAQMAMDSGSIGEYLIAEVLDQQPERVQRLLVETSFLPSVDAFLARSITGVDDAPQLLADLARANSFVVPLDREYTQFRYHHLMADMLQHLLRLSRPNRSRELFVRTAQWYEDHRDYVAALAMYERAHALTDAARVLMPGALAEAFVRHVPIDLRMFSHGPAPSEGDLPDGAWAVARAIAEADSLDASSGLVQLAAVGQLGEPAPTGTALAVAIAELRLARRDGVWPHVRNAATRALRVLESAGSTEPVPGLRASLVHARAGAEMWLGDFAAARADLVEAGRIAERDGLTALRADILATAAFGEALTSRPERASVLRARAAATLETTEAVAEPTLLAASEAWCAYLAGDFDEFARVVQSMPNADGEDDAGVTASVALMRATLLLATGRAAETRTLIDASTALSGQRSGYLAVRRDLLLAEIETSLGRPQGALRILDGHAHGPFEHHVAAHRAEAYLGLDDVAAAQACLRALLAATDGSVGQLEIVSGLLGEARLAQREGDEMRCVELLIRATELADGTLVLPFAGVADVFAGERARHPALTAAWPIPPSEGDGVAMQLERWVPDLADPLTNRERAVLRYLATSMSTAEIATELYVSVNTIKTHLAAIYRKLAVRRRRDAVLRGRELELL